MATKKIYLFCEAGMSTSIMVNKMMEVVKKHKMPLEISAFPAIHAEEKVEQEKPVAILLGPQVRHLSDKMKQTFEPQGIPVGTDCGGSIWHDGRRTCNERCSKIDRR